MTEPETWNTTRKASGIAARWFPTTLSIDAAAEDALSVMPGEEPGLQNNAPLLFCYQLSDRPRETLADHLLQLWNLRCTKVE
jgi:hypothetical protein